MNCFNIFQRIAKLYWHHIASPEKEARHAGMKIGKNCLIATRGWSTEPYLITIGNNVQLTVGCQIHTHGGGASFPKRKPEI